MSSTEERSELPRELQNPWRELFCDGVVLSPPPQPSQTGTTITTHTPEPNIPSHSTSQRHNTTVSGVNIHYVGFSSPRSVFWPHKLRCGGCDGLWRPSQHHTATEDLAPWEKPHFLCHGLDQWFWYLMNWVSSWDYVYEWSEESTTPIIQKTFNR